MCTYSHLCSTSSLDYSRSNNSFPPIQVVMCSTYLKRNLFRSSTKGSVHHLRRQDTSATRNANRCLQCSRDTLIKQLGITKHTLRKQCGRNVRDMTHTHLRTCNTKACASPAYTCVKSTPQPLPAQTQTHLT